MRALTTLLLAWCLALGPGVSGAFDFAAAADQRESLSGTLPPIMIDALDGDLWSVANVFAAPGQTLIVTNRGVEPHTFTIPEWGISVRLETLEPVEITVPTTVDPGQVFTFFCSMGDHRVRGQEGSITIASPEQMIAGAAAKASVANVVQNRVVVETRDDFTFSPSTIEIYPGALIEVRNTGAIEHHFAVDAWAINETVFPGEIKLVQVPKDVVPGEQFTFFCTIPGHRASGMEGIATVVDAPAGAPDAGLPERGGPARAADLDHFLPDSRTFGEGWTRLRSGNASTVITGRTDFNVKVFPGDGVGAAYVGPHGSRATVLVLPFSTTTVPVNQVQESVLTVQASMIQSWTTDQLSAASLQRIPPPRGCDIATRASGIAPIYTLPAGSTVCQLRNAGVAIFVAVEGEIEGAPGVEAADQLITRLLSGS